MEGLGDIATRQGRVILLTSSIIIKENIMADRIFRWILKFAAVGLTVLVGGIFLTLVLASGPSIKAFGFHFLFSMEWDPVAGRFGALPFLVGTLLTLGLALIISIPFSMAIAILLGEFRKSGKIAEIMKSLIELLAGIPSIIYGFWGIIYLVPLIRTLEMDAGAPPFGVGILAASIILSVMIIPYSAALAREVISMVPADIKEAAYALGATRYEVIMKIMIPYAWSGISAGIVLASGRALGETMAVTMLIGNSNKLPDSIFALSNTMASVIANEFAEAFGEVYLSSLIEIGLFLFLITAVINVIGKKIISRFEYA